MALKQIIITHAGRGLVFESKPLANGITKRSETLVSVRERGTSEGTLGKVITSCVVSTDELQRAIKAL